MREDPRVHTASSPPPSSLLWFKYLTFVSIPNGNIQNVTY